MPSTENRCIHEWISLHDIAEDNISICQSIDRSLKVVAQHFGAHHVLTAK